MASPPLLQDTGVYAWPFDTIMVMVQMHVPAAEWADPDVMPGARLDFEAAMHHASIAYRCTCQGHRGSGRAVAMMTGVVGMREASPAWRSAGQPGDPPRKPLEVWVADVATGQARCLTKLGLSSVFDE